MTRGRPPRGGQKGNTMFTIIFWDSKRETTLRIENARLIESVYSKSGGRITKNWAVTTHDGKVTLYAQRYYSIERIRMQ